MSRAQLTSTVEQNTGGAVAPYVAGKNKIINGDFGIWQRGTSFTPSAVVITYTSDRWSTFRAVANYTVTRQATSDTTNLPSIQYCQRVQRTSTTTNTDIIVNYQSFESANSIPLAGKTITLSFYARAGANYSAASSVLSANLYSGTGTDQNYIAGYTGTATIISSNVTLTTTWQRFTLTGTVGATATELTTLFANTPVGTAGANDYYEITGVQVEAGSVATPFTTATGTLQGELMLCQRYCWVMGINVDWPGQYYSTSTVYGSVKFPSTMRAVPSLTVSTAGAINVFAGGSGRTSTAITSDALSTDTGGFGITTSATGTAGWGTSNRINSGATATWSAEL